MGRPVYVSIDIDVADPAYAPGTGTPEPGGCTSADLLKAVHMMKDLQVVGFDVVEVCPAADQSERTAVLAAKIIRELLIACSQMVIAIS
jgi:agmatinase